MIGPTGVGKTEIARRLARLANAPFVKVEATKFTEVGYVGRDVESIVRDLADVAVKMYREQEMARVRYRAEEAAEERILDALLPPAAATHRAVPARENTRQLLRKNCARATSTKRRSRWRSAPPAWAWKSWRRPAWKEMTSQLQNMFSNLSQQQSKTRKMPVKDAFEALCDEEAAKLVNEEELKQRALSARKRTALSSSTNWTRSPNAPRAAAARTSPAKAYSATCCR